MAGRNNINTLVTKFGQANANVEAIKFIADDPDGIHIEELDSGGVVNYIYRVQSADKKQSVVLKHAQNKVKHAPTEDTSVERLITEYNALSLLHSCIPGSVPRPYCLDMKHNIVAMEDMSSWKLLGAELQEGRVNLEVAHTLGQLLAGFYQHTARNKVTPEQWQTLVGKFRCEEMTEKCINFKIMMPFDKDCQLCHVPGDVLPSYLQQCKEIISLGIRKKMVDLFRTEQCFVHGDCHWNSFFIRESGPEVRVFDAEFSFLSHAAQDLAQVVVSYCTCCTIAKRRLQLPAGLDKVPFINDLQETFIKAIRNVFDGYISHNSDLCEDKQQRNQFLSEVSLFMGISLLQLATSKFLQLLCQAVDADRICLMQLSLQLILKHEILTNVTDIANFISKGLKEYAIEYCEELPK